MHTRTPAAGRGSIEGSAGGNGFVPQFDKGHMLRGTSLSRGLLSKDAVGAGAPAAAMSEQSGGGEGVGAPPPAAAPAATGGAGKGKKGGRQGGVQVKGEPGSGRKRPRPSAREYDDDEVYVQPKVGWGLKVGGMVGVGWSARVCVCVFALLCA